jgi:hypothetical protein
MAAKKGKQWDVTFIAAHPLNLAIRMMVKIIEPS